MSSVGVNAECLLLSASKRTLDTYVAELANHVPDVVKSVVNTGEFKRNEVFRDALLSFVSFQSVFWREHPSVGCLPGISNYLVLGYINGVQIWRLQPPSAPVLCRPHTERVVGFRTAYPVTTVQLLPDLPGYSSQPSCRLAVVQHKDGCNAVDIFSGSVSGNVHVLQQPWPILCLSASVSWGGGRNGSQYGRWIGTLVVATTQQVNVASSHRPVHILFFIDPYIRYQFIRNPIHNFRFPIHFTSSSVEMAVVRPPRAPHSIHSSRRRGSTKGEILRSHICRRIPMVCIPIDTLWIPKLVRHF